MLERILLSKHSTASLPKPAELMIQHLPSKHVLDLHFTLLWWPALHWCFKVTHSLMPLLATTAALVPPPARPAFFFSALASDALDRKAVIASWVYLPISFLTNLEICPDVFEIIQVKICIIVHFIRVLLSLHSKKHNTSRFCSSV